MQVYCTNLGVFAILIFILPSKARYVYCVHQLHDLKTLCGIIRTYIYAVLYTISTYPAMLRPI